MKVKLISIVLIFFPVILFPQNERYSRLLIPSTESYLNIVSSFGIEVLYVGHEEYFVVEIDNNEKRLLEGAGVKYEMVIADLVNYYQQRNEGIDPNEVLNQFRLDKSYNVPVNFSLGSMGGFCNYAEILWHMDKMANLFPNLISVRDTLSGSTIEGRPIYWQRISNNPSVKQNKPELFYNALIHAREPASMQQMLFYMYYLLENYATNDQVKRLVDNLELYFVPCANPDGYLYIQSTNPGGGGMWRKNRRLNYDNSYGVDLNRNFGYMWGYDNFGSSPIPSSITYRGEAPFSEPEAQILRNFAADYNFKVVLNYHSYANLLLHPYGYASVIAPDYTYIRKAATLMTEKNGYAFGTSQRMLYLTNGDATDWFYGEDVEKPRMFTFTPEVGGPTDGFWPVVNRIIPLCQENLHLNLMAAKLAGSYAEIFDNQDINITEKEGHIRFGINRLGLTSAPVNATFEALSNNILYMQTNKVFDSLPLMQLVFDSISFTLMPGIFPGERIEFTITIQNEFFFRTDTIVKIFGEPEQLFFDSCDNLDNWDVNSWFLNSNKFHSPPTSFVHHNGSFYFNNHQADIFTKNPISISQTNDLWVSFFATWDLDGGRDFVTFVVSTDNGATWQPYPGAYTQQTFLDGKVVPLYQGLSNGWVKERILIKDVAGKQVKFGFKFQSDNKIGRTGFFFDDFEVLTANMQTQTHQIEVRPGWTGISSFISPVENNIEQLFGDNLPNLMFLSDKSEFFQPGNTQSSLTKWNTENGYMVKADEPFTLIIDGYPKKSIQIELLKGYNLIPVLTSGEVSVSQLETIPPGAIDFIKKACGLEVYWPEKEIFQLEKLIPGRSYFIFLSEDATLIMH